MPSRRADSTMRRTAVAPARCPAWRGQPRDSAQRPLPSMMMATWRPGRGTSAGAGSSARGAGTASASCAGDENACDMGRSSCGGLAVAHGANERFHVIQVALQGAAAGFGEAILGARHAALEGLEARNVARFLEFARVHGEGPVGGLHELLELAEAQAIVHRQRAHDAEPHAL